MCYNMYWKGVFMQETAKSIIEWIQNLYLANKDAVWTIPTEVKTFLCSAQGITLMIFLAKKAWKFAKIVVLVILAYFIATGLQLI